MASLSDLRVLDISTGIAGPFAAKIFADCGADVVKIEHPDGDTSRFLGPFPNGDADPEASGMFIYLNGNKRGISLDVLADSGRQAFLNLVRSADIVIESFKPGAMNDSGVGFDILKRERPRIILTSVTPFGQTGPWKNYQATDIVTSGVACHSYLSGFTDREPTKGPGQFTEFQAGATAFSATLTALAERDATGLGQHVDVSSLEAAASMFSPQYLGALHSRKSPVRYDPESLPSIYPCKDGYVSLNVRHEPTWQHMWLFFDDIEMADDPRFARNADRRRRKKELDKILIGYLAKYTMDELFHGLAPLRIMIGMALTVDGLLADRHLKDRGYFIDTEHPVAGKITIPGKLFGSSIDDGKQHRNAPQLGEHNDEVLSENPDTKKTQIVKKPDKKRLPLQDVRAVVLTQAWAGAYATRLLADMGAQVIQVESLDRPDPWRGGYPPRITGTYPNGEPGERPYNRNASYNSVNTNKLAITLDLNSEEGMTSLLDLISSCDIFAENFSARVIPNFGLEFDKVRKINPSLIMLRMPSYGCSGPYSTYMGNGGTTEPMSGISSLLGYAERSPMNSGFMHTDPYSGMLAYGAMLAALHHRARTGEGQLIDMSQQETTISLIADRIMERTIDGKVPDRIANYDRNFAPHSNFRCKGDDSWVAIAVRSDDEWTKLCEAIGRKDLASDSHHATADGRRQNAEEIAEAIFSWTNERDSYEVTNVLQRAGVPSGPVLKALELPENPQLKARDFFDTIDHPETGPFNHAGTPWRMSRSPERPKNPSPGIGQHSVQVLTQILGLSEDFVDRMVEAGITGDTPTLDD